MWTIFARLLLAEDLYATKVIWIIYNYCHCFEFITTSLLFKFGIKLIDFTI